MNNSTGDDIELSKNNSKQERTLTLEHYFGKPLKVSSTRFKKRKMENNNETDVDQSVSMAAPTGSVSSSNVPNKHDDGSDVDPPFFSANENSERTDRNSGAEAGLEEESPGTIPYDCDEGVGDNSKDSKKYYSDSWDDDDYAVSSTSRSKGWTSGWSIGWTSGWSSGWSSRDWSSSREDGMEEYRKGYPKKKDSLSKNDNYLFYTNQICSEPDSVKIDNIHKEWWGAYEFLEAHHGYIQWLFPIRESGGMNFHSQELQKHEAERIIEDKDAHERVLTSYRMMLDFFGMELSNRETGEISRSKKYRSRMRNLNNSYHNYLRITRILKSLGEFDFEYLKKPWLNFFINEIYIEKTLCNAKSSCENYWVETIKDDEDRSEFIEYISECNSKSRADKSEVQKDDSPRMGRKGKRYVLETSQNIEASRPSNENKKSSQEGTPIAEDKNKMPSREDSPISQDMNIPSLLDD